jgi:DNA polymerase-3 subunit delta
VKLDARRVEAFLDDPGAVRVALFHGEDSGLIREWAARLVRAVAGSLDDAFRITELDREAIARLPDEIGAMSMMGGRRVVRVRDATDAATGPVQKALATNGPALVVLEGVGLGGKSRLKTLLDRSDAGVTIACYPMDARAMGPLVRASLAERQVTIQPDALEWLSDQLGADRAVTRSELEKLALYVGQGGVVDITAARLCVGDLSGLQLEDALFAATEGEVVATDRALELALAEGATPVGVLRAGLMHLQRFARVRAAMAEGASAEEAVRSARPPVFFRREPAFSRALRLWSLSALDAATARLWEAERACKQTGSPAETLCRNAILGLAQRAAIIRRR